MSLENMNLPVEILTEADGLLSGGYNLAVPADAEADRKNGWARFTEYASVESAHREEVEGKEGQKRTNFVVSFKILPFNNSPNGGKTKHDFNRLNFGALRGEQSAVGTGNLESEKKMSAMSLRKIKQLLTVAGVDLSAGLSGDLLAAFFPQQGTADDLTDTSPLVGCKVAITISDNAGKQYQGANRQNLDTILPAPEGM
jgi:hypothetical protein